MKLSYRIATNTYSNEKNFEEFLSICTAYKDCIDEIALFTDISHHGYYPLEETEALCVILKDRIKILKEYGFTSVGINSLCTLGHMDEAWDWFQKPPFQVMVGQDGEVSKSCLCPNTEEFRAYITKKYQMYALTKPSFIWIDDDIRMQHHGVPFACFCPNCISIYNRDNNTAFTRVELVEKLNSSDGKTHREQWVRQNIETINNLLKLIEQAIHSVNEDIAIGLMIVGQSWTTYSGCAFDKWFTTLKATKARPGGGFFDEDYPMGLIHKALNVGRQKSALPEFVTDVQYELENFLCQRLTKSLTALILECTTGIACGMNGIAFNALHSDRETNESILKKIRMFRSIWDEMDKLSWRFKNIGFYPALSSSFEARRSVYDKTWFEYPHGDNDITQTNILCEIGIPLTMDYEPSCGIVLMGNMAEAYTKNELMDMLAKGVLMDGRTLEILEKEDLGEYCGVKIKRVYDNGIYERLTSNELNGIGAGSKRNIFVTCWKEIGNSYVLEPYSNQVNVLSDLYSVTEEKLGSTMTAFENSLGGRVVVHGYAPWKFLYSVEKREQMLNVCDWISKQRMPVIIEKCVKVIPLMKLSNDHCQFMLVLVNGFMDETGSFDLQIRVPDCKSIFELKKDGSRIPISSSDMEFIKNGIRLHIENIMPWDFMVIISE